MAWAPDLDSSSSLLKKAELEIDVAPVNLFKFCFKVTLLSLIIYYSMVESLNCSEEMFFRFFCCFNSYILFLAYYSDNSFGYSILGGCGSLEIDSFFI